MIEEKLKELGLIIPQTPAPLAAYIPAVQAGKFVFTSGQVPLSEGKIKFSGKVGKDLNEKEGQQAAELCALNCLSAVKGVTSSLDNIERIIKLVVYVNSDENFTAQPKVANGASELMIKIFGEKGKHARSAVGVSQLPMNASVEIEMIVLLK